MNKRKKKKKNVQWKQKSEGSFFVLLTKELHWAYIVSYICFSQLNNFALYAIFLLTQSLMRVTL